MNKPTNVQPRHNRAGEIFEVTTKRALKPDEALVVLLMDIRDRLDVLIDKNMEQNKAWDNMRVSLDRMDRRMSGKIDSVFK
tara:strand:+ start:96 stop:338 length:243 start_codon:yes stop_codon:yes gene_type:complete